MEKRTLYALVAFVALGLGAFAVMRTPEKGERQGPRPRPVDALKAADVQRIEVTTDKQEQVVVEKAGDKWHLTTPKDWPADSASVKALTDALEKMTFGDLVTESKDKHEEMSVAEGKAARLIVKGAAGKVLADLYVGKNVGGFTMVRPAAKNEVWQANGLMPYLVNKDAKGWRDHLIFEFASNDADKLTVESAAGSLLLSKLPAEKDAKPGDSKWKIEKATGDAPMTSAALDGQMATSAVQALSNLRAADFADDKKPEDVGLAQPALKLTVDAKGKAYKLLIGSTKGDDIYVQAAGGPQLYSVKKYTLDRANHRLVDYRDKTLAKVKEVDLASIDLALGTESISLTHAGDKWKSAKPVDDAKLKPIVGAFENLAGGGFAEEKDPAKLGLAKPAGTVTLHLKDKSTVVLKIGNTTQDKADYFVQRAGSPDVLLVKKYLVDKFLKKPADLAPGPPGKPGPQNQKTADASAAQKHKKK